MGGQRISRNFKECGGPGRNNKSAPKIDALQFPASEGSSEAISEVPAGNHCRAGILPAQLQDDGENCRTSLLRKSTVEEDSLPVEAEPVAANDRGLEFKVGAFVFIGFALLAALVVQFGRLGEGFKDYYALTIRFSDASGLLKGSDVLLAGAKIGRVAGGPRLVKDGNGVDVPLRIYDFVKIPTGSRFTVGSSGLLGDRFVNVTKPSGTPSAYVPKDSLVEGTRETGMDDLTREGGALVNDLRKTVQNIDSAVSRLNQEALSPGNMQNLKQTFEHLSSASASLSDSSKKLDGVMEKADAAAGSVGKGADDLRLLLAEGRKTVQSASQVLREAREGKGLLPALLTNQELAADLRALVSNLRAHGVLFYRDNATKMKPSQAKPDRRSNEGSQ